MGDVNEPIVRADGEVGRGGLDVVFFGGKRGGRALWRWRLEEMEDREGARVGSDKCA